MNRNNNSQKFAYREISSDSAQNSEFIGIDKKYEKKIDELEKNILTSHNNVKNKKKKIELNFNKNNNIENFSNKLKVNIISMEDYALKKKNKNKKSKRKKLKDEKYEKIDSGNRTEINGEKEEQNINGEGDNDNYNNESEFLSKTSNIVGKRQLIFKK